MIHIRNGTRRKTKASSANRTTGLSHRSSFWPIPHSHIIRSHIEPITRSSSHPPSRGSIQIPLCRLTLGAPWGTVWSLQAVGTETDLRPGTGNGRKPRNAPRAPTHNRTLSYLITFSHIPELTRLSLCPNHVLLRAGEHLLMSTHQTMCTMSRSLHRRAMMNWRTSLRRFITTVGYFSQLGVQDILKRWNKRWKSEEKKLTGSLNDRAVKIQLGVSSPLLCFDTFQIRNGRDGAALSEPLCVHSFGFSRSLHLNLVREYTGEFVMFHSGMFLILLHVEKNTQDNTKINQKQADKMVK